MTATEPTSPEGPAGLDGPDPSPPDLIKRGPGDAGPADEASTPEPPARMGANELGRISVEPRAVEKIAALAAAEIPDAGGTGRARGATSRGRRRSSAERLPKVNAEGDGDHPFLRVELWGRWPLSVPQVTEAVHRHVIERVTALVGLEVREVRIEVTDLLT